MTALLIVDVQNDFLPGGSLAVKEGDAIIPVIKELLKKPFDTIVASKDWHPKDHGSFATTHGKKVGDIIDLQGLEQILWPVHCVAGTSGAEFGLGWDHSKVEKVFYKGIEKEVDSYSTFFDNGHCRSTGLADFLHEKGIKDLYIAGLTTEYCVLYSSVDALKLGFNVFVVADGCRAINLQPHDEEKALKKIAQAGGHIITSKKV